MRKVAVNRWCGCLVVAALLLLLPAASAVASDQNAADDFEMLMARIRDSFAGNPDIRADLQLFDDSKGCFKDVDYSRQDRTNWMPLLHVDRLYAFVFAYTNPKNAFYGDDTLYQKIVKGLEYWYDRNPHCSNWWYNQIAEPQRLGVLLIQMRTGKRQLPKELEAKTLQRMEQEGGHPAKWTGANRTDIALHWMYRSCLQRNDADLKTALENVYSPVGYTVKEGFQYDGSYFQHGLQLYIGGYGDEILKGLTQVAMYTQGTKYALEEEKIQFLGNFMRHTYYQTIRGRFMLFDVLGRGVSRRNATDKGHTALFAKRMLTLDPTHADAYKAIIARLEGKQPAGYEVRPSHTHYFRGDYTLHVRPGYSFDVRMVSNRTLRCEYGNGENLKTYFMSDGCTNVVAAGDEYAGIFPVWNWSRIPGVTAPQLDTIPMAKVDWMTRGTSTFAGGVSDSLYGVSAYAYSDDYAGICTAAKKAWFFFDDEVVCLGAGIRSASSAPVCTTINQCLLKDKDIWMSKQGRPMEIGKGRFEYEQPDWVWHNGVGYVFPSGGNIFVSNEVQSGTWYDINHTQSPAICKEEVFTLGVEHGLHPDGASYAYLVVPGLQTIRQLEEYVAESPVEILANTDSFQVVHHKELGLWQMVFYAPGSFKNENISVSVDRACTLMINEKSGNGVTLHVADPGQTQSCIQVDVYIPARSLRQKVSCHWEDSGVFAGASRSYRLL